MNNVTRYELEIHEGGGEVVTSETGGFVDYDDYLSQLQQTSALQTSLNNIINAFGISGEGAHSKLVIEYVHGLVAENAALKNYLEPIGLSIEGTPATDTGIAEIEKRAIPPYVVSIIDSGELESICWQSPHSESEHARLAIYNWRQQREKIVKEIIDSMAGSGSKAARRAANLRAGRKG